MPRLRTLKPEFFTHELLAEVSPLHRILYAGLWCHADREGRLEDRPRYLKTVILPYDECPVDVMLEDLQRMGFIVRYEIDGVRCIHIPAFLKHQNPHAKERPTILPPPPVGSFQGGPRPPTPAQGVVITHAPESPVQAQGKPGTSPVLDPEKDRTSRAVLSIGLGSGLGSTSGLDAVADQLAPEPEAFEPDADGVFKGDAWGFWGWHNQTRQANQLFHEAVPPDEFKAWYDRAVAKVGIDGMARSYKRYLEDADFQPKFWPFGVFMHENVWFQRANAPPRKQVRL